MIPLVDGWNGIPTHLDLDTVTPLQLTAVLAIEGHRCRRPGILGNVAPKDNVVGKHHGAEAEYMRANGSD